MLNEIQHVQDKAELIFSPEQISAALDKIALQINTLLADRNPLVLCVMNGGLIVAGQLLPRLTIPLTLDAINASRYKNQTTGGEIEWIITPRAELKGRTVLIIDDILDEGVTLNAIFNYCIKQGAMSVYSAVLLDKELGYSKPINADFVGLNVVNRYLFGYGLDYKGYLRNANGIYAV